MQVVFKVKAYINIPPDQLFAFQGDLKKLSEENFNKLRSKILESGFNFSPHVWSTDKGYFILDGHQRIHVLKQLIKQGYEMRDSDGDLLEGVPCNIVEADSIEDAKDKVLQAVSQYGKLTAEGFLDFTDGLDLDFTQFDLPDFEMPVLDNQDEVFPEMGEGAKDPFQKMTFIFADTQANFIQEQLKIYEATEENKGHGNANPNGNKIYGMVKEWAEQKI